MRSSPTSPISIQPMPEKWGSGCISMVTEEALAIVAIIAPKANTFISPPVLRLCNHATRPMAEGMHRSPQHQSYNFSSRWRRSLVSSPIQLTAECDIVTNRPNRWPAIFSQNAQGTLFRSSTTLEEFEHDPPCGSFSYLVNSHKLIVLSQCEHCQIGFCTRCW